MSICLFERFRCEHLIEGVPIIIGRLLVLTLLRAPLALLIVETIITPVGLLVISIISPILCGPVVPAIIISSVIGVVGRWVRKSLRRRRVGVVTARSVRSSSLIVHGMPWAVSYTHLTLPTTPYV